MVCQHPSRSDRMRWLSLHDHFAKVRRKQAGGGKAEGIAQTGKTRTLGGRKCVQQKGCRVSIGKAQ